MNRWLGFTLLLITLGALALRLPVLDARPMHNDEAVNAIKLQALWEKGDYRYDPDEYHGPVLHYATLPVLWLGGARNFTQVTEFMLRLAPVLFGAGLILLLLWLGDGLGRVAIVCAALFTAVSPAMVFYSRYFIHEMLLVFFTALLLAAGWRWWRTRRLGWALMGGAALGLMYATKETFVLEVVALVGAGVFTWAWGRWCVPCESCSAAQSAPGISSRIPAWHVGAAILMAGFVALAFFSSFFTNASGPLDAVRTYFPWLRRAGGDSPHIHPWYFYLERLLWFHHGRGPVWSEAIIFILAGVGFVAALRARHWTNSHLVLVRFLGFYTLLLTAIYSLISYKTPWCMLGFLHGMILLAGVGAAVLLHWRTRRWVQAAVGAAVVLAWGHLVWESLQTSFVSPADRRNPYVYAQTAEDVLELVQQVQAVSKAHPDGDNMLIKVMIPRGDYWPLPWYLRQFNRIGWWDQPPADPVAPVMIVGVRYQEAIEEKVGTSHQMTGIFCLRPQVSKMPLTFVEVFVEETLWKRYLDSKQKSAR